MRDRRAPRGGATNRYMEYLIEAEEDTLALERDNVELLICEGVL